MGFSVFDALTLVGALAAVIVPSGLLTHAAAPSTTASYTGTAGSLARAGAATSVPKGVKPNFAAVGCVQATVNSGKCAQSPAANVAAKAGPASSTKVKPSKHAPAWHTAFNGSTRSMSASGAPKVSGSLLAAQGGVRHNFNGLGDLDQANANGGPGFEGTPPDQGLCVGPASALGGPSWVTAVVELVNDAFAFYSVNGAALLGPLPLVDLFNDPAASGDIRCHYEAAKQTYFFTEIGVLQSGSDANNVATDLTVINAHGVAFYQVDTSVGGTCFPDFPMQGYDTHAFYLSINQFCGPQQTFVGGMVWAFSKPQLVARSSSVNFVTFGPLALSGDPVLSLQPAFGDASGTEYLVNSCPYDQFGNNNSIANTLGLWNVNGDQYITSGNGAVTLHGRNISSETYAFPMPAASTGTGKVTCLPFIVQVDCTSGINVLSEPFLDFVDSRAAIVQLASTSQGLRLYTAVETALTTGKDPSARDGVAWFVIDPAHLSVAQQGYVGVAGTYLLMPSILHGDTGTTVIDFSMTSPTRNRSTGYAVEKAGRSHFGAVQTSGLGYGPHDSFSGVLPGYDRLRWGDYSFAALDPNGSNIWAADEYIPSQANQDPVDTWGTRVWDVQGA
jgi:hypothetical protein